MIPSNPGHLMKAFYSQAVFPQSYTLVPYQNTTSTLAMIVIPLVLMCLCLTPFYSHFTDFLLPRMILFLIVFLASLFFIPTLRLKICPTDS